MNTENLENKEKTLEDEKLTPIYGGNGGSDDIVVCPGDCHGNPQRVEICRSLHVKDCDYGYV